MARDREIPWERTRQDAKVKLMISNELGFTTMGSNVLKGEIPVGWHTGKHAHGEESMHILQGQGFSIIDGQRFDWHRHTTIQIPYRAEHQHFNTGDEPVQYIAGMIFSLETYVRVAGLRQIEDCGPNDPAVLAAFPAQESEYYRDGHRAIIHIEDAPSDSAFDPQGHLAASQNQHHFQQFLVVPRNGFREASVAVTHLWEEPPYHHSGRHKHLEAVVYAVEGEGFTEMLGEKHHWEAGDVLYVPPAMWEHEHYNDNPKPIKQSAHPVRDPVLVHGHLARGLHVATHLRRAGQAHRRGCDRAGQGALIATRSIGRSATVNRVGGDRSSTRFRRLARGRARVNAWGRAHWPPIAAPTRVRFPRALPSVPCR